MPTAPPQDVLQNEFLAGGFLGNLGVAAIQAVANISPLYIDDNTTAFGYDIYQKMLKDDDVSTAFETRKLAACSEGARVQPAVGADKKNAKDQKNIYAQFIQRCMDGMGTDLTDAALELMEGKALGSKIAEITFGIGTGEDVGRIVPTGVYVRDSLFFTFLVDGNKKLMGVVPMAGLPEDKRKMLEDANTLSLTDKAIAELVVPRYKLIHFVNDPKNGDITGTSILRAAYTPWFIKTQLLPEYFKYLKQFASPSVVGKLPKPSDDPLAMSPTEPVADGDTVVNTQKAQVLLDALLAWQNAYALVVKGGTEIDLLKSDGTGEAYNHALDYFGRQIAQVILGTSQATKEAQHESKSSKGVAQDVMGLRTSNDRRRLSNIFTNDFARNIIRMNFGDSAVKDSPLIAFTQVEQHDRLQAITVMSSAHAQGFVQDEQLDDLYDELGLPAMPEGWLAEKKALAEQQARDNAKLYNPDGNPPAAA